MMAIGKKPYDADGNMTAHGEFTYTFTNENALSSVADSQGVILEFTYDYRGRRVRKVEYYPYDSQHCCVVDDTRYVYDGWNLILELDGQNDNAVLRKYAWGLDLSGTTHGAGGIGGLLAMEDTASTVSLSDDTRYLYSYDGNGNVGQLTDFTDPESLSLAAHYEYDPYGNALFAYHSNATAAANPFRFSTKYFDDETGFYYYGYRYYRSDLGRWLNRDPIGELDSLGPYGFVLNSPIGLIDPFGLCAKDCLPPAKGFPNERNLVVIGSATTMAGKSPTSTTRSEDMLAPIRLVKTFKSHGGMGKTVLKAVVLKGTTYAVAKATCKKEIYRKLQKTATLAGATTDEKVDQCVNNLISAINNRGGQNLFSFWIKVRYDYCAKCTCFWGEQHYEQRIGATKWVQCTGGSVAGQFGVGPSGRNDPLTSDIIRACMKTALIPGGGGAKQVRADDGTPKGE